MERNTIGGYTYAFVDTPYKGDYCVECKLPAKEPRQGVCDCGHLYCKTCLEIKQNRNENSCGTCNTPINAYTDHHSAKRIGSLRVRCPSSGCSWNDELRRIESHLNECNYVPVSCPNQCCEAVNRFELQKHLNSKCAKRQYACPHCSESGPYKFMITDHLNVCPDCKVPCPNKSNGCQETMKRKALKSHLSQCQEELLECPFKDLGCKFRGTSDRIVQHKSESLETHFDYAVEKIREYKLQLERCENAINDHRIEHGKLKVHIKMLEAVQASHVFKMPAFLKHKDTKISWYSPGFYTQVNGYKFCLSVVANGKNGEGEGTHVSMYLYLMKGENDDNLVWPVKYKYTVSLLNQLRDDVHYTCSDTNTRNGASTQRVLKDAPGTGWGRPKFIGHDQLWFQEENQCQYLKDDCLFFKVIVEVLPECKPWLVTVPT